MNTPNPSFQPTRVHQTKQRFGDSQLPRAGIVIWVAIVMAIAATGCSRPQTFVRDGANLMSHEQVQHVSTFHSSLLKDHDIDYRVVTENITGVDINDRAEELFTAQKVGSESRGGRGLLLVLNTTNNQVRLEVSRSLEAVYPDAFVGYLEKQQMTPFFAAGRVADGILATTELIVTRAQHATKNRGWDDEVWAQASTAGAGATADARLNQQSIGPSAAQVQGDVAIVGDSPQATLTAYMHAMASHNANSDLSAYSAATRTMLKGWVMTTAQMNNLVNLYRNCLPTTQSINVDNTLAVIRYPIEQRQCSPWFFVREQSAWRLDLFTQQRHVRFGRDNSWHFTSTSAASNPFHFAFEDWEFDGAGYPMRVR